MRKWMSVLFIVAISVAVVFFRFNQIPIHTAPDEIAFVRLALHLKNTPYTMYTALETGHATLYFYLLLLSFKLFGVTLFALRFPAALCGVLSAIVLYFIYQTVWSEKKIKYMPFLTTIIFVTSRWYITFARFSFEATFLLLLELISLLSIFYFGKTGKLKYAILSGIFAGLAFHSYIPGRIFFLVPLASFWGSRHTVGRLQNQNIKENRRLEANQPRGLVLYLAIPFLLICLPLLFQIHQMGDYRVKQESVFADDHINMTTKIAYIGQNIVSNVSMLFITGDMNGRHNYPGKPALNPILGFLFLVGIIPFFGKRKKTMYDHVFFVYLIISLIPTLLTSPRENPNMLRTYTMLPSIMYFIGKGITSFYDYCHAEFSSASRLNWIPKQVRDDIKTKYIPILIMLLIIFSSLYELRTYFIYQKEVSFYAFEVKKPFEWIKARNFNLVEDWYKP